MYDNIDFNTAEIIEAYKSKISIAEKAVKQINSALFNIKDPTNAIEDINKVRDALSDLEMFLMKK